MRRSPPSWVSYADARDQGCSCLPRFVRSSRVTRYIPCRRQGSCRYDSGVAGLNKSSSSRTMIRSGGGGKSQQLCVSCTSFSVFPMCVSKATHHCERKRNYRLFFNIKCKRALSLMRSGNTKAAVLSCKRS